MTACTADKTAQSKARALKCVNDLPPFSPTLNRLLATLAKEDASFSQIGDLIEKDTVVSGNILHLVNSALYGRRGTINSVRHAVSLLGVNKLRNAALGMSITRMWNDVRTPPKFSMARFNKHAAATAILADLLAQRLPVSYPEGAFVAGLLHDVGRLLIAIGLREEHQRITYLQEGGQPQLASELEVIGITHPELSAEALHIWQLPVPIQGAVRYHHEPSADDARTGSQLMLSDLVDASNRYVNTLGVSIVEGIGDPGDPETALEHLPLRDHEGLMHDFDTEFAAVAQFFG